MMISAVCTTTTRFPPSRSTGKERDTESGNDYFGARYYSSAMGRFMSPDWSAKAEPVPYAKLDDPQSLNLYSYVRNNPLARTDPDGHCDQKGFWCANWSALKADTKAMMNTLQAKGQLGVGLKLQYKIGHAELHGGGSLHVEKSVPLVLNHKSGEIIPNAEPTTAKLEVDAGVRVGAFEKTYEGGINGTESDAGGMKLEPYHEEPIAAGGEKITASAGDDRISVGAAGYLGPGGGGEISVDRQALQRVVSDVADAVKHLVNSNP